MNLQIAMLIRAAMPLGWGWWPISAMAFSASRAHCS